MYYFYSFFIINFIYLIGGEEGKESFPLECVLPLTFADYGILDITDIIKLKGKRSLIVIN